MVTDPVCKMEIDTTTVRFSSGFEGETYFFCSEGCQAEFTRHPQDYLKPAAPHGDSTSEEAPNV